MTFFERIFGKKAQVEEPAIGHDRQESQIYSSSASYQNIVSISFNGEKNLGELGPIMNYIPDYAALRYRGWQAYLDSEVAQTVITRFTTWIIGAGLKLQCEPQRSVLEQEGITFDPTEFNRITESRFRVYSESSMSAYSNMGNLHQLAETGFINAHVGGDALVILRLIDNEVKVDLIDGAHVQTPLNAKYTQQGYVSESGNRIVDGIELTHQGEHAAYWIRKADFKYERIAARGPKSGMLMAFMVYGLKYRLNFHRGLPLIVAVMETAKKLERYKEATVGSAEERQKIPFYIKHELGGSGENPLLGRMAKAFDASGNRNVDLPADVNGNQLANTIAATTNKQTFNMPQGAELKSLESKNELAFGDFYLTNFDLVCATVNIPPNVAMSKYDSNFSASRAALKDWEHTINVKRKRFKEQFYQPIYNLWLHKEILRSKIHAPGYLTAFQERNAMALEAIRTARFVGATVPHIDPVKEVKAEREKLGPLGANIPLTTVEAATEALAGGEWSANMEQFAEELEQAKGFGLNVEKREEGSEKSKKEEESSED